MYFFALFAVVKEIRCYCMAYNHMMTFFFFIVLSTQIERKQTHAHIAYKRDWMILSIFFRVRDETLLFLLISNGTYGGFVSKNKIYTHSKQTSNKLGLRSSSSMRKAEISCFFLNIFEYIFCVLKDRWLAC